MANVSGGELAIVIRAVDMATPTLAKVKGELAGLKAAAAAFNAEAAAMTRWLGMATVGLGVGLTAAVNKAVDAYAEFETSVIELAKKTGMSGAALDELVDVLTRLSTFLPTTRKQMVDLAVEAAKLGIEGTENIAAVVQAALKFQEATSGLVKAEEALTALGKILTAMKLPWTMVENLGSAIVKLADVSAADVPEILQELQKVAAIASVMGLTADQTASLVTQIIAFGHVAGRTGLRLSRIIQLTMQNIDKMKEAIFGKEEAPGLLERLEIMGFADLARQLTSHPYLFIISDLNTLNETLERAPIEVLMKMADFFAQIPARAERIRVLTQIFGSMAPYFMPLVEGMENFQFFLEQANTAFTQGTELTRQYQLALTTLSTQQKIVEGNFETAIQQIGEGLAPMFKAFNEQILQPFSTRLVEITQQFAQLRREAAATAEAAQSWVFQVAKVRLEGIAEAIERALLEGDYRPALRELSIVVGGVVLMVQAWHLAAEALVALKAFFKTAIGSVIWDVGTCILTANFVFEMLPESVKRAIDEATDKAAEWISRLPLPEGLKNAIQGYLDKLGEEQWTTVITFAITWFIAKNAWHLLMQTLFAFFSQHGLSPEAGGPGQVVVRGMTTVLHATVNVLWTLAKTLGTTLIEAIKDVLWAVGFSAATGGLMVAGALLTVGFTLGLAVYGILKLAKMDTQEFEEAIATETMRAVEQANRRAAEAMREATERLREQAEEMAAVVAENVAAASGLALSRAVQTADEYVRRAGEGWEKLQYRPVQAQTLAGLEAARYLAMSMARIREGAFDAERAFSTWSGDIERALAKGESLVSIFGTIVRSIKDTDPYRTILSPITLEQLAQAFAEVQRYLEGLTEEQRLNLGLDEAAYQDLLARIRLLQEYIQSLPQEVRIRIIGEVDFPTLAGLADIWARLEVEKKQAGGPVPGRGRGDIVPALLEPGEFVVPRWMMRIPWVASLIYGIWQHGRGYQAGGPVVNSLAPAVGAMAANRYSPEDIARERARLEKELLRLQGDIAALRELELQELHESNRELQRQIWALEEAQEITREREALERQLLELQGNTAALRARELAQIHEANRALQQQIWRLQDWQQGLSTVADLLGTVGQEPLGGLAAALEPAVRGDLAGVLGGLFRLFVETGQEALERMAQAAGWARDALLDLGWRAQDLANSFVELILSSEHVAGIQRSLARAQEYLVNALLGFLAPIAWVLQLIFGLLEDEAEQIEETTEQTRKSLASLGVPTGYKLERAAWGVARPGEPWREDEEDETQKTRDRWQNLLRQVPSWLRDLIERFRGAIEAVVQGLRNFLDSLIRIWQEVAPPILEAFFAVLKYFVSGLQDVVRVVETVLKPALLEFAGPILQLFGQALSDLAIALLSGLAAGIANIALPVLHTFGHALAELAGWVRAQLLPDFLQLSHAFRQWWQAEAAPFLQAQVFPKLAEWGQALYSWIKDVLIPFLAHEVWPFLRDRLWPAIVGVVENKVIPALERIWRLIEKHWPTIEDWIVNGLGRAIDQFVGKLELAAAWVLNEAGDTWGALRTIWESQSLSLWDKLVASAGIVLSNFNLLGAAIGGLIGAAFGPLGAVIGVVIGGLTGLLPGIANFLGSLAAGLGGFLSSLVSGLASAVGSLLSGLVGLLGSLATGLANVLGGLAAAFGGVLSSLWTALASFVHGIAAGLGSLLTQAANLIFQPVRWVVNFFIGIINAAIDVLNWALGWVGVHIPKLPYLERGGYVLEEGLAYLHKGELVVPAQVAQAHYGGTTIYIGEIHLHGVQDPEAFLDELEAVIRRRNLRGTGSRYGTYAIAGR